jgi:hypothetical protein
VLDWAALGLTLLPFLVGAIVLVVVVRGSYLPIGDQALTEMHVRDIGHHSVLTGLYSRDDWSHPGPMLFYVLAPFYWLTGGASIAMGLGTLVINGASIVGMALVARRRGGAMLMLWTLLGCSLLVRTLGADFVRDPWNNYVTVLPFGLLIFLVWAMVSGELWALPVGVVVASFLGQTHVGFVALALPLLAFGAIWLAVSAFRSEDTAARWRLVRTAAFSFSIGLVLWLPVIVDTVIHRDSNVSRIIRWFRDARAGVHTIGQGWRVVAGQFAAVPEWMTSHRSPLALSGESSFLYQAPFPVLLLLVAGAGVGYWQMKRTDGLRLLATITLTFALGVLAVARTIDLVFDYRLRWTWVLGMVGFVAVVWCAALGFERWRPAVARRVLPAIALVGLAVCTIVNVTTAATAGVPQHADSKVLATLLPRVLETLDSDPDSKHGQVIVDDGFQASSWYSRGLVLQLERRGYDARMPSPRGLVVDGNRQEDDGPVGAYLVVASDNEIETRDADPSLRLIAKWSSVGFDQQLAYKQAAAALDRDYAAGSISSADRALALRRIDLGNRDPAVSWAVAVYQAEPAPE